jgi:hypothetical protein
MEVSNFVASPDVTNIGIADILGLWEVIRINRKDEIPAYPWITGRFKFNFLDEMLFLLTKDGQHSHGTWELTEKAFETKERFSISLNGTFEYTIVEMDEDEMTLSDRENKYLLVRRL